MLIFGIDHDIGDRRCSGFCARSELDEVVAELDRSTIGLTDLDDSKVLLTGVVEIVAEWCHSNSLRNEGLKLVVGGLRWFIAVGDGDAALGEATVTVSDHIGDLPGACGVGICAELEDRAVIDDGNFASALSYRSLNDLEGCIIDVGVVLQNRDANDLLAASEFGDV